jgi:hypothetical protein
LYVPQSLLGRPLVAMIIMIVTSYMFEMFEYCEPDDIYPVIVL